MAKFFHNRCAEEVKKLLEAWGYRWTASNGDDAIYTKEGCSYTIKVPVRNETIPNGTMDYIKKCLVRNGATRKEILTWWKENGYGE